MLVTETQTQVIQYPETEGNWLYKDFTNAYTGEVTRQFGRAIKHDAAEPLWSECTPEEKTAYEESHSTETYAEKVNRYIREQYDQAKVEATTYNYLEAIDETSSMTEEERAEAIAYYKQYQEYRKECKRRAQEESESES